MANEKKMTPREFLSRSALAGGSLLLTSSRNLFAGTNPVIKIKSKGYAAIDTSGKLVPWEFERRRVGDDDVLIEIKYASICHSNIHQMKGHWGPQQNPQVPGHEIVGIISAVGKNVTKFILRTATSVWV